jgi:predicted amidohydrolase
VKVVYLAHPFRCDPKGNRERAAAILKELAAKHPDVVFFSPLLAFSYLEEPRDRNRALAYCLEMIERCDELWLAGEWWISEGCMMEQERAERCGIPVRILDGYVPSARTAAL